MYGMGEPGQAILMGLTLDSVFMGYVVFKLLLRLATLIILITARNLILSVPKSLDAHNSTHAIYIS